MYPDEENLDREMKQGGCVPRHEGDFVKGMISLAIHSFIHTLTLSLFRGSI